MKKYIFKTERLGFRNWLESDLDPMSDINNDDEVMEFFPGKASREETLKFINRMKKQYKETGFCYFALEKLDNAEFIGFIGLSQPNFKSDFTPCIDIGWRLKRSSWNKGYATEGAKACLNFAFDELKLDSVYAIAPEVNIRSQMVMERIGMKKVKSFIHPLLLNNENLKLCVLYQATNRQNG